eukprot:1194698-Prorocentrum_minimum.AAC.4
MVNSTVVSVSSPALELARGCLTSGCPFTPGRGYIMSHFGWIPSPVALLKRNGTRTLDSERAREPASWTGGERSDTFGHIWTHLDTFGHIGAAVSPQRLDPLA